METFPKSIDGAINKCEERVLSSDVIESVFEQSDVDTKPGKGASGTNDSITFWNIDEQPSVVDSNTYKESSISVHDKRCFQVSGKLEDELANSICRPGKQSEPSINRSVSDPVGRTSFGLDNFPSHVLRYAHPGNGKSEESKTGKVKNEPNSSNENSPNDEDQNDSDIVEINLTYDSPEQSDKKDLQQEGNLKNNQEHKKENGISTFKFTKAQVGQQEQSKNTQHHSVFGKREDPWYIGIEDSENIFTKSLLLSGITQPQAVESIKRPHEMGSPERQAKRVKRDHIDTGWQFESDKINFQADPSHNSESAEFCPPVAIVFPLESEQDFQKHQQLGKDKVSDNVQKPSQGNLKPPLSPFTSENSKVQNYGTEKELILPGQNDAGKDTDSTMELIKIPKAERFSNLDFDIDIQDCKDDFPIDITPTINHLDEYEEVLAGLIGDTSVDKDSIMNTISATNTTNQTNPSLKDQSTDCIPPNVTYFSAMKHAAPPISKWPVSSHPQSIAKNIESMIHPQSIAKNIESMISCNTMRPGMQLGANAQQSLRMHHQPIQGRSADYGGQLNMLQSYSLHSDSNLLRKMISTPITDDPSVPHSSTLDRHISTAFSKDSTLNANNVTVGDPTVQRVSNDKGPCGASIDQTKAGIARVSDKPAISEQIRARVTLHHTGEKEQDSSQLRELIQDSTNQDTRQGIKPCQDIYATSSQQPLTLKTHNVMDRGVQDVLLQHSLRRKQLGMTQMYRPQSVQSPQVSSSMFPADYLQRQPFTSNDIAHLVQQRRLPTSLSHVQNAVPTSVNSMPKHYANILDKAYNRQDLPHSFNTPESVPSGYSSYQRDISNNFDTSHRISPKDQYLQHMREQNAYAQQNFRTSMMQNEQPRSLPTRMHPLPPRTDNPYAHMSALGNQNLNVSGTSSQNTRHAMPMYPGQFPRVPGNPSQYPNFPGKSNQFMGITPGQTAQDSRPGSGGSLPLDWDNKQTNTRMPFMSDYLRQQMSGRVMSPTEAQPFIKHESSSSWGYR